MAASPAAQDLKLLSEEETKSAQVKGRLSELVEGVPWHYIFL